MRGSASAPSLCGHATPVSHEYAGDEQSGPAVRPCPQAPHLGCCRRRRGGRAAGADAGSAAGGGASPVL